MKPWIMIVHAAVTSAFGMFGSAVLACETALILAIDVSNSVDVGEYRIQVDGLADALRDPEIAEALVQGQVALALLQWSGETRQELSIPWTRMETPADVVAFARQARFTERAFVMSDTAPAEAIAYALQMFSEVEDCTRRVIDVSGDGTPNSGSDVLAARLAAERQGVTINGVAIESLGVAITGFYQRTLVTRDGFVITARGHRDYPRAIRAKIIRELSQILG